MSDRPWQLMLVDDDPVFRLGLRIWLEPFPDLQVVAETDTGEAALQILTERMEASRQASTATAETQNSASVAEAAAAVPERRETGSSIDLVIVDLGLGSQAPGQLPGLMLCQQLKVRFPALPLLVLSAWSEPVLRTAVQQVGADGYCLRGLPVQELAAAIRQVAAGQSYWAAAATLSDPGGKVVATEAEALSPSPSPVKRPPGPLIVFQLRGRSFKLQQIDAALAELAAQMASPNCSFLEQIVLAGQQRELQATRWFVNQLPGTPPPLETRLPVDIETLAPPRTEPARPPVSDAIPPLADTSPESTAISSPSQQVSLRNLQSLVFEAVFDKLQDNVSNHSNIPLEIDILRADKKRELFYTTLRTLENLLADLRYSQITPEQLREKRAIFLRDLRQSVITEFFGKYYTLEINNSQLEVVDILLQDAEIVEGAILDTIPLVPEWLAHLLFREPLVIDSIAYPAGSPEALARAICLLENLLIQGVNGVVQPLLNRFADVEVIKQNFYDYRLLSSREIERFRNNLSWQYRLDRYINQPKAIFESQYRLMTFTPEGIQPIFIYAPRQQELGQLTGIRYTVTLMLETRDAIAPRLRSTLSVIGTGLIYVLTDVVGRGLGLIGRGVIQGIGSAWQERKLHRNSERQR
ncbi:MAG: DUF3685 domain-containing protein [Cyanothece sp. SIO1E1]|nr:DUF3685 domain-containing protein [Cyanothece sp. SIO1E1]